MDEQNDQKRNLDLPQDAEADIPAISRARATCIESDQLEFAPVNMKDMTTMMRGLDLTSVN